MARAHLAGAQMAGAQLACSHPIADKYNITGLVKECVDFPIKNLPNVFVAFEQAQLLNMEVFAFRCLHYIDQNMSALIKSEAFLQIDQDLLYIILERDGLRISEIEVWNAALRWADEQCRQNGIECSAENRREIFNWCVNNGRSDQHYQHYSHPKLSDAPGLIKLKFPTHRRDKNGEIIEMEIGKVSEFAQEPVRSYRFSDAVDIGGFSCKILAQIKTKDENNEKWLGFYLYNNGHKKASPKINKIKELLDASKGFYNKDEDKVKLAIDVIVKEPKTEKFISDTNKSNGTLSMEIEKLSEFAREIELSERKSEETVYIKGMPWKIWANIKTKNESTDKCLGFFLLCDASEKDGNWSRKCSATLRIVSQKNGVGGFMREFNRTSYVFNNKTLSGGWNNFIYFAELMYPSKGLYNEKEDKVTLAIDFSCE
ncbi:hypothetical protein niasHT_027004 [Heterodera trifolii]|uniref:MATH domain-containing protein n=1 Tax=Heterodera trifolii TaxID=157864 RepID=A0ABD2JIR3_9BILA